MVAVIRRQMPGRIILLRTSLAFCTWLALTVPSRASAIPAPSAGNELVNPGFEAGQADSLDAWHGYGRGYVIDRDVVRTGRQAVRCSARGGRDGMGAVQTITYEAPDRRPIVIGGWSKAQGVGGGGDYSVYLDILYEDGTPWWGKTSPWSRGTHDWEYSARVHRPQKPVKEIKVFVFLRRTTGTAWFDDLMVCRGGLHVTNFCLGSDYPRTSHGLRISAELTQKAAWQCLLLGKDGKQLDALAGTSAKVAWRWPGRPEAIPQTVRIVAQTANGDRTQFDAAPSLPKPPENPVRDGYVVWTQDSMAKAYPTAAPPAKPVTEANLMLAQNEHEGLQIAIKPADRAPLNDVQIEVGNFVNASGDVFPARQIQWHVVGYVWVDTPSGHPLAPIQPGWCPEVLLPARPFDVLHGRTQTVWLDFSATKDIKPGTYRGNVRIRPANAAVTDLAISVRVRSFALPRSPHMKTAFALMDGFTRHTYGTITPQLRRRGLDIMLDHRLNPDDISRTEPPPIEDLLYARERGLNAFNIVNLVPKPKGSPLWVCYVPLESYGPNFTSELAARIDDYMARLREHGLSKLAYFYGFDERREEYDSVIRDICRFLKERYPEVSTFTTAGYMYEKRKSALPDDQDYMDWYCPLTPRYEPELSARLRRLGKQVWWYVCCGPQYPYANFASMDYPAIEGRLLGWMTYGYEADGLLFWHVNLWQNNKIIDGPDPYLDWQPPCVHRMTGDGCLAYPTPTGPVSSIRLEKRS